MKANTIDSYVAGALKIVSPNLAKYYLIHDNFRRFVNFSILYFVTYWVTVPMTVIFAFGLGATPLAWVLSGFFVGTLLATLRFVFSNYWIWKEGKGQSLGEPLTSQSFDQVKASPPPTTVTEKVVECSTCHGEGTIGDNLCTRCRGYGKIRIVPRGTMPTIGGKSSSTMWKIDPKSMQLMFIILGILVAALGSRIPIIGNYIALFGVGIIMVSIYMFKPPSKKTEATKPDVA